MGKSGEGFRGKTRMTAILTNDAIQKLIDACPFNLWMGMRAVEVMEGSITLSVRWREEFLSNLQRQSTHGGILASIIDAAGVYALATLSGKGVPTVDLRVDYHRVARPGNLQAMASIIASGSTLATAETRIVDANGRLVASGRAVYFVGTQAPRDDNPTSILRP
jgi:uncharacterized protein (TIGR00369 family)